MTAAIARHMEAMTDVVADIGQSERREFAAHGDSLIDLPHLRHLQVFFELGLTHEHDLQQLLALFEVREDADLLEQSERQVLRFVNDHDGEGLQRHERIEELVQWVAQIRP